MKVYLAGKVSKNCWRHQMVRGLRDVHPEWHCGDEDSTARWGGHFPLLPRAVDGRHDHVGPYFVGCDHGCYHGHRTHGLLYRPVAEASDGFTPAQREAAGRRIHGLCLDAVDRCDLLYAWVDAPDCYGTVAEMAWARQRGKQVWVAGPQTYEELWFTYQFANLRLFGGGSALDAFRRLERVHAGAATLAEVEPATARQREYLVQLGCLAEEVAALGKKQAQVRIAQLAPPRGRRRSARGGEMPRGHA